MILLTKYVIRGCQLPVNKHVDTVNLLSHTAEKERHTILSIPNGVLLAVYEFLLFTYEAKPLQQKAS